MDDVHSIRIGQRGPEAFWRHAPDVTHETRLQALERACTDLSLDMARIKAKSEAPVDVMKIGLSLKLALSLVGSVVIVVLGAWSSAAWVKSDIQALRGEFALETRLNDERNQSMMKSIEELRKRQELTELEVRNQKRGR